VSAPRPSEKALRATHCDLKAFFDTVNHERLMTQLREKVRDRKVLALIRRYLCAGVMLPDGTLEATPQGVPQGGPLSPLLANIVLDPLDKELERRAHRFARYADDFIVMVRSPRAAERVKASLTRFAEEKLKLVINRTKSKAAPLQTCAVAVASAPPFGLSFGQAVSLRSALGFQIGKRGKVVWTQKVQARFKQRVRQITRRNRGHEAQEVIDELRLYVTGWVNYFGISHSYRAVEELADWIRRRVRLYYWKQWKQPSEVLLCRFEHRKGETLGARMLYPLEFAVGDKNDVIRAITRIREVAYAVGILRKPHTLMLEDGNGSKGCV
jgi:RNA-directed DNA polymerase